MTLKKSTRSNFQNEEEWEGVQDEDKLQARGKSKSEETIRWITARHNKIEELLKIGTNKEIYQGMKKILSKEETGFDKKRVAASWKQQQEETKVLRRPMYSVNEGATLPLL